MEQGIVPGQMEQGVVPEPKISESVPELTLGASERLPAAPEIPDRLYFRIGDVSDLLGVKPYVLRYWESEFPMISPDKSRTGHRVYRRGDVETLLLIKHLLYTERYSIEGARKRIRELRKEGELKTFKEEKVLRKPQRGKNLEQIRAAASELRDLLNAPIREIFRY